MEGWGYVQCSWWCSYCEQVCCFPIAEGTPSVLCAFQINWRPLHVTTGGLDMSSLVEIQARLAARKRAAAVLSNSDDKQAPTAKRWRRKGEVDSAAEEAYRAEQVARQKAREQKLSQEEDDLRRRHGKASAAVREGGSSKESGAAGLLSDRGEKPLVDGSLGGAGSAAHRERDDPDGEEAPPLTKAEVVRKLRGLGEPVTYFGESDWARFRRLRNLSLKREEEGHGQKNVFQDKMREIERQDAVRLAHEYAGAEYVETKQDTSKTESGAPEKDSKDRSGAMPGGEWNTSGDKYENEPSCSEEYVLREIRRLVAIWQSDVDAMSADVRRTNKGRTAMVTLEQTKEWLKPLNRQLRKRRLPPKILNALASIFRSVSERDYLKADSAYYEELAIGKAPWPMGATMVGIHARAAREKIGEGKIAHVMNDEQSRKYIQAVKRLVSLSQKHFP